MTIQERLDQAAAEAYAAYLADEALRISLRWPGGEFPANGQGQAFRAGFEAGIRYAEERASQS